jgi:hypothetical protein
MAHQSSQWLKGLLLPAIAVLASQRPINAQQPDAPEKPATRILAHYMPWYEAKPQSRHWGWHWTMGVFDPEDASQGRPAIASHYWPLIGPYDSGDPDVIEYHALLMKLAGIDGVVLDWYGTADLFDYASIHRHASAFVDQAKKSGLQIAVCYEDRTIAKLVEAGQLKSSERVEHAKREIDWLRKNWFREPAYLKFGDRPVLLSFGRDGLTDEEWQRVLDAMPGPLLYLSEHSRRVPAAGAFDWPVPQAGTKAQAAFYRDAKGWSTSMAVAFPRFHDIYQQAKVHKSWGTIDDNDGKTFVTTLEAALKSGLPLVQICTWNDWGEGTAIEPSADFGYRDLEAVARLRREFIEPRFATQPEDLRLPLRLYHLRKRARQRGMPVAEHDQLAGLLAKRALEPARELLNVVGRELAPEP